MLSNLQHPQEYSQNTLNSKHSMNNEILSVLLSTILFLLFWFALIF